MYIQYTVFKHELDNTCKSLQSSFHISSKWPIVMESFLLCVRDGMILIYLYMYVDDGYEWYDANRT